MPAGREASGRSHAPRAGSRPGRRAQNDLVCSTSVLPPPPLAALPVGSDRRHWRARSLWPRRADPEPARPSLAVGLFGRSAGEHARGPALGADHIPLGPGREAVPVGFSGQSRPNPIHGFSIGRLDYFSATTGLLLSYFGRVVKIARRGGARPPTAGGRPAGPRAALDYFPITCRRRGRRSRVRAAGAAAGDGRKSRTGGTGARRPLPEWRRPTFPEIGVGSISTNLCSDEAGGDRRHWVRRPPDGATPAPGGLSGVWRSAERRRSGESDRRSGRRFRR